MCNLLFFYFRLLEEERLRRLEWERLSAEEKRRRELEEAERRRRAEMERGNLTFIRRILNRFLNILFETLQRFQLS